jgi:hypothetical protein
MDNPGLYASEKPVSKLLVTLLVTYRKHIILYIPSYE